MSGVIGGVVVAAVVVGAVLLRGEVWRWLRSRPEPDEEMASQRDIEEVFPGATRVADD